MSAHVVCPHCQAVNRIHEDREPAVRLAKVDTEAEPGPGARYNIRSIPTLALFRNGREIARQAGAMGAGDIVRWTRSAL